MFEQFPTNFLRGLRTPDSVGLPRNSLCPISDLETKVNVLNIMSDCGLIVMNYDIFAILRNDSNDFHVNEVHVIESIKSKHMFQHSFAIFI